MNKRGEASCVCGYKGPVKTINGHRRKCYKWRKHNDKLKAKERDRGFVLTPI